MSALDVLTTGQVANLAGVRKSKVHEWIDGSAMAGYRIPGSTHRRVHRAELIRFMTQHGMFARLASFEAQGETGPSLGVVYDRWGKPVVRMARAGRDVAAGSDLESSPIAITSATDATVELLRSMGFTVADRRPGVLHRETPQAVGEAAGGD